MLFEKKIAPRCEYCVHGTRQDGDAILCSRRGTVQPGDRCRRFRYDPLRRTPPAPATPRLARDEDFSL